jgi:hypothetical protein
MGFPQIVKAAALVMAGAGAARAREARRGRIVKDNMVTICFGGAGDGVVRSL